MSAIKEATPELTKIGENKFEPVPLSVRRALQRLLIAALLSEKMECVMSTTHAEAYRAVWNGRSRALRPIGGEGTGKGHCQLEPAI